jgi:hypothetical protein
MKQRLRQLYPHHSAILNTEIPRGWINQTGHFLKTKEHWASINSCFRRPEIRAATTSELEEEEAKAAERNAHLAYSLGWISVGHAGKLNAVGHERTFQVGRHPAVLTLRKLLEPVPELTIQIEIQLGNFNPSAGLHEDFDVRDYDLDFLIKRGRLRQTFRS